MKVSGTATLHGPVDRVYAVLNDPAVLVRTIPGCERLEQTGTDAYRMTVTAGVASIRGSFSGDVRLTDQRAPHSFVLRASGSGAPGTVTADVAVTLADSGDGGTLLSYDADAVVGGMVGGVGQRVLSGVAKKTAAEFFTAVDNVLTGTTPPPNPAPGTAAAQGTATTAAAPGSAPAPGTEPTTVFTRPATAPRPGTDPTPLLAAAALGALTALAGVALGWLLGRKSKSLQKFERTPSSK
jgi:carbon monoxide dehydrogenase subunit G